MIILQADTAAVERFWCKVDRNSHEDCWEWTSAKHPQGYGQFSYRGAKINAHRIAYELKHGEIPAGLEVDHVCRNRGCVNPAHLEAVTHAENVLRGEGLAAKQANQTHCIHGHQFNAVNTYWYGGKRICKPCGLLRKKAARLRKATNVPA